MRPAETFFFKTNGEPITEREHTILYDIKLRNQFPMCLAYGDGATVPDDEIAAIQKELDEKLPGVEVMFIPTVLYEKIFQKVSTEERMANLLPQSPIHWYMSRVSWELYHESSAFKPKAETLHYAFNEQLLMELLPNSQPTKNSLSRALYDATYCLPALDKYAANLEMRAFRKGQFLLWRGTNTLEEAPLGNQALCFGSSLYGCIFNAPLACAWYCISQDGAYGYAVPIPKKEFRKFSNYFYVPPITTIQGLFGTGDFSHPRTKYMPHKELYTQGLDIMHELVDVSDDLRARANKTMMIKAQTPKQAEQIHRDIFKYVRENRIIIKSS